MDNLLRVDDVMDTLSVSRSTVWRMIRDNQIPSVRILRSVRIRESDLAALVTAGVSAPTRRARPAPEPRRGLVEADVERMD